jgi:hypothetical protein
MSFSTTVAYSSLADQAWTRYLVALLVAPIAYAVTWIFAFARSPRGARRDFVRAHWTDVALPMFLMIWFSMIPAFVLWLLVGAIGFDRHYDHLAFVAFWLISYVVTVPFLVWRSMRPAPLNDDVFSFPEHTSLTPEKHRRRP